MENLTTTDLKLLLTAANNLAKEIKTQDAILQKAGVLCLQQMQKDTLSVLYATRMLKLLGDLKTQVVPPLTQFANKVSEDAIRVRRITEKT